ncbi:Crossover junction endonuclease mus81 [Orbilia brochopaga]|uniref:Crossover junction endonuclease MUS81 n=1 Tax=Orbilia brochopaga TaxID=3140254 RepID=A0AAV9U9U7_9PEZI
MRACPTTFAHPSEAKSLIGIGDKIADRLTKQYIKYKEERGETPPPLVPYLKTQKTNATKGRKRKSGDIDDIDNGNSVDLAEVPGENVDSLFDSREPVLGRWDTARPAKKTKKNTAATSTSLFLGDEDGEEGGDPQPAKKPRKPRAPKQYVPRPRTGGYAILRAFAELDEGARISKDELCRYAQPFCDSSFTLAGNQGDGSRYTAWSSVKTLKDNGLVAQNGRPALFSLTPYGWEVVDKMLEVEGELGGSTVAADALANGNGRAGKKTAHGEADRLADRTAASATETANAFNGIGNRLDGRYDEGDDDADVLPALPGHSILSKGSQQLPARPRPRSASAQPVSNAPPDVKTPFTPRYLRAGQFTVHLVLDNREVAAKTDRDYIQRSFENVDCPPITRSMELGDVMWVARGKLYENGRATDEEAELALDHICERKRLDDLISSIKDGRFHEQKFRLGKLVGNTTYIIEVPNGRLHAQATPSLTDAITTAIYSTQVVNGFFVKLSPKLDDTVRYLARFTRLLKQLYEGKDLYMYPENLVQIRTFTELKLHLKQTQPDRDYLLSYNTLAAMASKSRTSTLRDVFLKMLMCTRGLSAEKALEIQRHFKTPRELLERYARCGGAAVGKTMMMSVVDVAAKTDRRKIKGALSGKIWEVWGA